MSQPSLPNLAKWNEGKTLHVAEKLIHLATLQEAVVCKVWWGSNLSKAPPANTAKLTCQQGHKKRNS